jgi:hypothetical protein
MERCIDLTGGGVSTNLVIHETLEDANGLLTTVAKDGIKVPR